MQNKTDKFFDKIVKKDYNDELEKVLEKKYFDEDAKSLLLNILYKIEAAYKDYENVKQNVEPKEVFIKNIIESIEKNCDTIKLVKPNSEESKIIGNRTFLVEKNTNRIICYPIERKLLYSIAKISKNEKIIKDDYFLINRTLSNLINVGNSINTVEPLRDFNGYSWTTINKEIESIEHNLIYQNLIILLGNKFLEKWINNDQFIIDYMELFETKFRDLYGEKNSKEFIDILKQISILIDIKFNRKLADKIIETKKQIENKLEEMEDNKKFINTITKKKKILSEEIKRIDETINNKSMLQKEYDTRNEILPLEQKIFSVRILSKLMIEERRRKIEELDKLNELLKPQNFVKLKKELEEKDKYLKLINTTNIQEDIDKLNLRLQEIFLESFNLKIKKAQEKQELIKLIYELRYYYLLPYNYERQIKEIKEIEKSVEGVLKNIIQKSHKLKVINTFAKEENLDYQILKNIFNVRIINLEGLYIKVTKEKDKFFVQLFDDNIFEEKIEIKNIGNINKKDLEFKIGKKVKIFN